MKTWKQKFKPSYSTSYSFIEKSCKKAYITKVWLENNYGRQHGIWFLFTGKLRKYKRPKIFGEGFDKTLTNSAAALSASSHPSYWAAE